MTPKEKAIELYENFAEAIPPTIDRGLMERDWISSKECALIAVDEILGVFKDAKLWNTNECKYWQQVKDEITKL